MRRIAMSHISLIHISSYKSQTFVNYMDDNKKLRDMIETGKGNLQWERDIPASALANLQQLAQKDFRPVYIYLASKEPERGNH